MFECGYRQTHAGSMEVRCLRGPGTAATDNSEQADVGAVSWTQIPWERSKPCQPLHHLSSLRFILPFVSTVYFCVVLPEPRKAQKGAQNRVKIVQHSSKRVYQLERFDLNHEIRSGRPMRLFEVTRCFYRCVQDHSKQVGETGQMRRVNQGFPTK